MYTYVLADSQRIVKKAVDHVFATGEPTRYEIRGVGPDGSDAWYESRVVPIKHADVVSAALIVATDVTERKRLESEILAISDREQQRIGQDLHDDLCQRLAASAFAMTAMENRLRETRVAELAREAREIAGMITTSISLARDLARGLYPVQLENEGLQHALRDLALTTTERFGLTCRYLGDDLVIVEDHNAALQLFRIAQEAVYNAVRHADASLIKIVLRSDGQGVALSVTDNGIGFAASKPNASGMGMNIMSYRSRIIGAQFDILPGENGGTSIRCLYFPSTKSVVTPKGDHDFQES
jgi:signal transduction histidine kinase